MIDKGGEKHEMYLFNIFVSLFLARSLARFLSLFLDNSHVNATTCVRCFRSKHDTSVLVKQHMGKLCKVPRSIDGKYFSIIIIVIIVVTIIIIIIFVHSIITLLFLRQTVFCTFTDHYYRIPSSSFPSSSSFSFIIIIIIIIIFCFVKLEHESIFKKIDDLVEYIIVTLYYI